MEAGLAPCWAVEKPAVLGKSDDVDNDYNDADVNAHEEIGLLHGSAATQATSEGGGEAAAGSSLPLSRRDVLCCAVGAALSAALLLSFMLVLAVLGAAPAADRDGLAPARVADGPGVPAPGALAPPPGEFSLSRSTPAPLPGEVGDLGRPPAVASQEGPASPLASASTPPPGDLSLSRGASVPLPGEVGGLGRPSAVAGQGVPASPPPGESSTAFGELGAAYGGSAPPSSASALPPSEPGDPASRSAGTGGARADDDACLLAVKAAIMDVFGPVLGCVGNAAKAPTPQRVIFMDPTTSANIGDNLIALGIAKLLKDCGLLEAQSIDEIACYDFRSRGSPKCTLELMKERGWRNDTRGLVIFQGGGNWGNLYTAVQRHRLELLHMVATNFPAARVVSMPQSAFYASPKAEKADVKLVRNLSRLFVTRPTLTWRDRRSFDIGWRLFPECENILVPDAAFMLHPVPPPATTPVWKVLVALRTDVESKAGGQGNMETLQRFRKETKAPIKIVQGWEPAFRLVNETILQPTSGFWNFFLQREHLGAEFISMGGCVVTDKLHISILCLLAGKPSHFVQNSYNKTSNVLDNAYSFAKGLCGSSTRRPQAGASFIDAAGDCLDRARLHS